MIRRRCITTLAAFGAARVAGVAGVPLAAAPGAAPAHAGPGPVTPPVAVPELSFTDHLGQPHSLRRWLSGQVTVVQTIFTGCSSVCPIQGALFAAAQRRIAGQALKRPVRWLSISIDPLGDTPELLRAWLQRMGPLQAAWTAGLPNMADVERLRRALDGGGATPARALDDHSDKVYFVDAQAHLRWRTAPLPTADELARVLVHLAS